jgi:hypothetical protein
MYIHDIYKARHDEIAGKSRYIEIPLIKQSTSTINCLNESPGASGMTDQRTGLRA